MKKQRWILALLFGFLLVLSASFRIPAFAAAGVSIPEEQIVFMQSGKTMLSVVEVIVIQNGASVAKSVKLPLLPGYQSLEVKTNGAKDTVKNDQVSLHNFVPAHGSKQVSLVYKIPFPNKGSLMLVFQNPYSVDALHLYIPIGNFELSAANLLATTQTAMVGNTRFRIFTRLGIPEGIDYTLNLGVLGVLPTAHDSTKSSGLPLIGEDNTGISNTWQAIANLLLACFILALGFIGGRFALDKERDEH